MTSRKTIAAIVVAAGRGERASADGDRTPKQYRLLAGVPVLVRTINALLAHEGIDWVLPVIHPEHAERYAALEFFDPRVLEPAHQGELKLVAATRHELLHGSSPAEARGRLESVGLQDDMVEAILGMAQQ